ncbi:DUF5719 family protein [Leifsonia sp. NPDC080035]|uniref:DUF5719 family protein n=1 Tax=Leifsonia sp. NPDC080035 TaxID=3143936 RepID=A0AAU7G6N8_9MICO
MADKRALAKIGVRALGGVIGIGVAVVAVAGASLLPLPSVAVDVPASTVHPVPADQQRVCPGPVLALAADAGQASRPAALGSPTVAYGTDGPEVRTRGLQPDADTGSSDQAPTALTVSTPQGAEEPPLFAGAQVQDAVSEDLAGLAAAACSEPSADSWLSAGSTSLGQTSLVLLSNPTSVDATVSLTVYTESGLADAPGGTGITVPAGAQKVVPLAGLAPAAVAPVVHVQTTGGQVVATIQQSFEQGIQPRGVEQAGATGSPSRVQRIAGVTIATLAAVTAGQSAESVGVDFPAVRILVPGAEDAQVTIGAVGENGTAAGNSYAQTVKAGNVAEIPLGNLKDGSYTVTVNSSVPVVASVRTSVIGSKARDFAWFASSPTVSDKQLVAVPTGPSPVLHFANAGEKDVPVTVTPESGAPFTVTVPAEGGAKHAVKPGTYTVEGAKGLIASVSFAGDGLSSSFALEPPGPLAAPIDVYPR